MVFPTNYFQFMLLPTMKICSISSKYCSKWQCSGADSVPNGNAQLLFMAEMNHSGLCMTRQDEAKLATEFTSFLSEKFQPCSQHSLSHKAGG